ncbi:MAG TPA: hypothetical protein VHU42_15555, partial [Rhodopila sp.]|nr:hypothetical protein [Rhodopila sp.]
CSDRLNRKAEILRQPFRTFLVVAETVVINDELISIEISVHWDDRRQTPAPVCRREWPLAWAPHWLRLT